MQSALASPGSPPLHLASASPFDSMGVLSVPSFTRPISSYLPSKVVAQRLWHAYLENVNPCNKVIHVPTAEVAFFTTIDNPSQASAEALALCFSIYYAAVVSLEGMEVADSLSDSQLSSLQQFKTGLDQAFAHSSLLETPTVTLLQAMSVYMVS